MTVLTDRPADADPSRRAVAASTVTALLHVDSLGDGFVATLDALAAGSQHPDHVLVLDASGSGTAQSVIGGHPLADAATVSVARVTPGTAPRAAYDLTTGASPEVRLPSPTTHVWLLAAGQVPSPGALRGLVDALRRSPSAGLAGPKVLDAADPTRLRSAGIAATRTGRVLATPEPGGPDMGQLDGRSDVLAVPAAGLFVERALWDDLGGFLLTFGDLGADVDLSWRAHLAGRRVLVVPSAHLLSPAGGLGEAIADTARRRRDVRRVALARCAWWTAPLIAAWVAVCALGAALALFAAKRPRAALAELGDIGALLDPWRTAAGRWHGRRTKRISRRNLTTLFVDASDVRRHVGDLVHQAVGGTARTATAGPDETADDPTVDIGSLGGRLVRNPGFWVVLATAAATAAAWRGVAGGVDAFRGGLSGGELVGSQASTAGLFHDWWDGWSGPGLGTGTSAGPASALLAVPAWLLEHVPMLGVTSPGGAAVATLLALALPGAALSAYLAGRVATTSRWPRALVALAWAGSAAAAAAMTAGRVGALVALVLLPLVAAGTTRLLSRRGTSVSAAATGVVAAVLGAFAPALLVLVLAVLVVGVVAAPGAAKGRAALAALLPLGLLGPWAVELVRHPAALLSGPGLVSYGAPAPDTLHLAVLFPGDGSPYPWYAAAPLIGLAALALLRGRRRWLPVTALGLLAVVGLAATLAAPRVRLGSVPAGLTGAGRDLTPWWGLPMLVALLGLLAVVLVGLSDLPLRRERGGWAAVLRWPAVAVLAVVAVGGLTLRAWYPADGLRAWSDPRPAVAVDQATGPLANRTLLLTPTGSAMGYRLVGREAPVLVRGLPTQDGPGADQIASAVRSLVDAGSGGAVHAELLTLGAGFVGLGSASTDAVRQQLDATAGLVRMGSRGGFDYWRVQPPAGAAGTAAVGAPRAFLTDASGVTPVAVTGEHGATATAISPATPATLTMAEPRSWAGHAVVQVGGHVLTARADGPAVTYTVPAGRADLTIDVAPPDPWWRWGQLALLAVALFLAVPTGRRRRRTP